MLPKPRRLNREIDIARLLASGTRVFGKFITLRYSSSKTLGIRCGFIVSKKVHNKPVKRNLVKRRLRAIVTDFLPRLPGKLDLLISAKPQAVTATYKELQEEVAILLKKSKLIPN